MQKGEWKSKVKDQKEKILKRSEANKSSEGEFDNVDYELLKYDLEQQKFRFSVFYRLLALCLAAFSVWYTVNTYHDNQRRKEAQAYHDTISRLERGDKSSRIAALYKLPSFQDNYSDILPILVSFTKSTHQKGNHELNDQIINTFMIIGKPATNYLKKLASRIERDGNQTPQWLIKRLLMVEGFSKRSEKTNFQGITLQQQTFKKGVIENADLKKTIFIKCVFNNCIFKRCILGKTLFKECEFANCIFDNCDLTESFFQKSSLTSTTFEENCNLYSAVFSDVTLLNEKFKCNTKYTTIKKRRIEKIN